MGRRSYLPPHRSSQHELCALREGLRLIAEEGLGGTFCSATRRTLKILWAGLEELDLPPLVPKEYRLPSLTTPQLSPSVDDAVVRKRLLDEYNIEIAGGFGPLAGKVWRIGLMGFSSRKENVLTLLAALKEVL